MMQDSYRELFLSESQEYLGNISKCLVKLEENPADSPSLNEIFRCVHTLKGMSATMGYDKLTKLSHEMEDLLDALRNKRRKLTSSIIDTLFAALDALEELFAEVKANRQSQLDISTIIKDLKICVGKDSEEDPVVEDQAPSRAEESFDFSDTDVKKINDFKNKGFSIYNIKINLAKDCVMKEARSFLVITNIRKMGEILKSLPEVDSLKLGKFDFSFRVIMASKENQNIIQQEISGISEIESTIVSLIDPADKFKQAAPGVTSAQPSAHITPQYVKKIQSMRIPVERLDKIMNLMGELAIAKIRLNQVVQTYKIEALEEVSFALERLISSLQDEVMQTRLLPVAYILDAFPRVVRDLARRQNKEVDFEILGSEIELDRMALDEISDPLLHLVRNAIDHGIESPEERKKQNKNPRGKIAIKVNRQRGQIYIEVIDDGEGVDFEAVRQIAISKGLITEEQAKALEERGILELISLPGFSTSKEVTDISGRGVGLDVVKAKIESLGGMVNFETKKHEGSRFILTLPLTLAIIKAMLVKVEEETFAVPLMSIRETLKINSGELKKLQNFEVVQVRDEVIPIIRLSEELGIKTKAAKQEGADSRISLVIVEYGKKALGLVVTHVLGEQDIAVKPLGSLVKRTKGIAGATILGDGSVALILDIMSLR